MIRAIVYREDERGVREYLSIGGRGWAPRERARVFTNTGHAKLAIDYIRAHDLMPTSYRVFIQHIDFVFIGTANEVLL